MVDLAPLFALGKGLVGEAIRTSGTEVTFTTPGTATLDRDTLQSTIVGAGAPVPARAIVVVLSARDILGLPGVDVRAGDWRILLLPATSDPAPLTLVEITRCKDTRLVGATAAVTGTRRDSSGAVLTVYARPALIPRAVAA